MRSHRVKLWHLALACVLLVAVATYVRHQLRLRAAIASALESEQWGRENELGGAPDWPMPEHPPELRWELWREGDELVVAYEVLNATEEPIWLYDVPGAGPEQIFVYPGGEMGLAVLFRGCYLYEAHHSTYRQTVDIGPRQVAAGEVVTGLARRALPLQPDVLLSWVNLLGEDAERVRLEIAWAPDAGDPEDVPLAMEPMYVWLPRYGVGTQRWLVSEPVELP